MSEKRTHEEMESTHQGAGAEATEPTTKHVRVSEEVSADNETKTKTKTKTNNKGKANERRSGKDNNNTTTTGGWFSPQEDPDLFRSARFEAYYRNHVVPNSEWNACMEAALRPLPVSFRLSSIGGRAKELYDILQGHCFGLPREPVEKVIEGETITVCRPATLPWYTPLGHAYQIDLGKRALKRIPDLNRFRAFLMREDRQGNITRQEAVSMIPPQLLDAKPDHYVLDMCAAPGSKTAQLLEAIHSGTDLHSVPTGFVIANDADPKRSYMLVHQVKRLGSPNFLVTTHEGQFFPNLYISRKNPENGDLYTEVIAFDRVLCDVPCSGDGTVRKSPNIWRSWNVSGGIGLHPLQLSIAWRSAQLLKVGGRMVYSTCSLNPIEDEAVVAELIRRSKGALRIVDVSDKLPGLIREAGMHSWKTFFEGGTGAIKIKSDGSPYVTVDDGKDDATTGSTPSDASSADAMSDVSAQPLRKYDKGASNHYEVYTDAPNGPIRMMELRSLADVEALPHAKQRRVRLSFFNPAILKQMQIDAQERLAAAIETLKQESESNGTELPQDPAALEALAIERLSPTAKAALRMSYVPSAEEMHLERCLRILPHRQDTGGFFIVLLEKVAPLPAWASTCGPVTTEESDELKNFSGEDAAAEQAKVAKAPLATPKEILQWEAKRVGAEPTVDPRVRKNKGKFSGWFEFPFVPLQDSACDVVESYFGMSSEDRKGIANGYDRSNLFIRADNDTSQGKRIYFLPAVLGNIVTTPLNGRLRVVHSGLKIFEVTVPRQKKAAAAAAAAAATSESDVTHIQEESKMYRVTQDALQFVVPHLGRQVIRVTLKDVVDLLRHTEDGRRLTEFSLQTKAQIAARAQCGLDTAVIKSQLPEGGNSAALDFWLSTKDLSYAEYQALEAAGKFKQAEGTESKADDIKFPLSPLSPAHLGEVQLGSVVLELPVEELPEGVSNRVLCAAWLTFNNLSLMVDKSEKNSLLEALDPQPIADGAEATDLTESADSAEASPAAAASP